MERRKYKRASLIGLVEVRRNPTDPPVEAHAINISYGGLAIYIEKSLTGRVEMRLFYGDGTGKWIDETVSGQVMWQQKVGTWYATGIQFDELNPQDHSMTLGFLESNDKMGKEPIV